jgi:hypothetical protein
VFRLLIRFSSRGIHQNSLCIPCVPHPVYTCIFAQSQFADFTFLITCKLHKSRSSSLRNIINFNTYWALFLLLHYTSCIGLLGLFQFGNNFRNYDSYRHLVRLLGFYLHRNVQTKRNINLCHYWDSNSRSRCSSSRRQCLLQTSWSLLSAWAIVKRPPIVVVMSALLGTIRPKSLHRFPCNSTWENFHKHS